jgi:MoxR-like ATPase
MPRPESLPELAANTEERVPATAEEVTAGAHTVAKLTAEAFLKLVPDMVAEQVAALTPRQLEVKVGNAPKVVVDKAHAMLGDVLVAVSAGVWPFLVGPAGSGKTTLAQQVCTVLKRKFYMAARVTSEYKLTGFIDAQGHCVRTQFREAYEHGGGFLFDEVDASEPDALTAFNAALDNGVCDFPDGMVKRHKDFFAIAAGNTFGRGADRQYVGRNQLDAATLDRFCVFEVDYDEQFENTITPNGEWTAYVQRIRASIAREKVRHIVSPRASIAGAKLLAGGMARSKVEEACIWKGLDATTRQRVLSGVR